MSDDSDIRALEDDMARLERRIAEIESRLAEAGRTAVFFAEEPHQPRIGKGARRAFAHVGRALLFDTETPDERGDETPEPR